MQLFLMTLFTALVVGLDQWTKYLVVENIPLFGRMDAIPGLFHLTYVQNTGAAWSLFEGMQWLFALVFLVFTALILWDYFKKSMPFTVFERWCIAAIYAGGLGNMIDRVRMGYVVDMIRVDFMDFPVFNVADCFITCGCAALIVSLLLFNKKFWKDDAK
ncbi:MAG: signal peptidase II [Oscillospiraceae bacterium]|nr:signal peptidase II [Oscillospiraceae bacterium]